jgi:hypothetical protein
MKRSLLLIGPFLFSVALQGEVQDIVKPEQPVTKTVEFSVFVDSKYSSALYKQSKARVELSIWKYTSSYTELVWHTTIDEGKLKNYPSFDDAIFREVSIHGIIEGKETLVAGYKVIYDWKGSELSYDKGKWVTEGTKASKVKVGI